jgi:hypothetical protein
MDYSSLSNSSEWTNGDLLPFFQNSLPGFKKISVTVVLTGTSRQGIWTNAGKLVASLLSPSVLELDGFEHNFMVYLSNAKQTEQMLKRWHKAKMEFYGYEYSDTKYVVKSASTFSVTNEGNLRTPAIVEIISNIGLVSATIYGLTKNRLTGEDMPIIINGIDAGKTLIIDGEEGLITQDGSNRAGDVVLYEMPYLMPGENKVVMDHELIITIYYKERYV